MPRILAWLQANDPQPSSPQFVAANAAVGVVILAILFVFYLGWTSGLARLLAGGRLLPHEPRRSVPWGLIDLVIAFLLLFALTFAIQSVLLLAGLIIVPEPGEDAQPISGWLIAADAISKFGALAITAAFIWLRHPVSWSDLGFRWDRLGRDCYVGLVAFCMLAPIVFGIQTLLVKWWPSKHPLIEMLHATPSPLSFLLACFSAIIVAPLTEEFAFRVLLQGWLEKLTLKRAPLEELILGGAAATDSPPEESPLTAAEAPPGDHHAEPENNPYASPQTRFPKLVEEPDPLLPQSPGRLWFLPILASALIFGLMHWSNGPDWIPLTCLALGLGYLYQRTHRAAPSVAVHFLLNGLSMIGLAVQIFLLPASK